MCYPIQFLITPRKRLCQWYTQLRQSYSETLQIGKYLFGMYCLATALGRATQVPAK